MISSAIALALLASGCASTGGRHGYPTQEVLQALAAADKPKGVFSARGLVIETYDLEEFRLPDELFRRELDLAVTHYQPEDHPWGRYAVLVLIGGPRSIARADLTQQQVLKARAHLCADTTTHTGSKPDTIGARVHC